MDLQLLDDALQKLVGDKFRSRLYDAQMVGAYLQPLCQLFLRKPLLLAVVLDVLAKNLANVHSIHV